MLKWSFLRYTIELLRLLSFFLVCILGRMETFVQSFNSNGWRHPVPAV